MSKDCSRPPARKRSPENGGRGHRFGHRRAGPASVRQCHPLGMGAHSRPSSPNGSRDTPGRGPGRSRRWSCQTRGSIVRRSSPVHPADGPTVNCQIGIGAFLSSAGGDIAGGLEPSDPRGLVRLRPAPAGPDPEPRIGGVGDPERAEADRRPGAARGGQLAAGRGGPGRLSRHLGDDSRLHGTRPGLRHRRTGESSSAARLPWRLGNVPKVRRCGPRSSSTHGPARPRTRPSSFTCRAPTPSRVCNAPIACSPGRRTTAAGPAPCG